MYQNAITKEEEIVKDVFMVQKNKEWTVPKEVTATKAAAAVTEASLIH